jgi:hypothetical protein
MVDTVLFVCAISSYDEVMEEDGKTNRLVDSLGLFNELTGNEFLKSKAFLVFLNKKDVFHKKIKKYPLSTYFQEYPGTGWT